MALLKLAGRSLWARRSSALLTLLSIAISVTLLLGVEMLRVKTKENFASTISGTDLIVGARTGQAQLLLYSVFHIGNATADISWQAYQKVASSRMVKWTIPIALGDSHRGYRVVGTNNDFFEHYRYGSKELLAFAEGQRFGGTYDAVIGAEVARKLGYKIGQPIIVSHGLGQVSFNDHKEHPFRIAGILQPTGTPVDRSVLVGLDAIEAIHLPYKKNYSAEELQPKSVTAFLVGMKSRLGVFGLQRAINTDTDEPLTAILPGVALAEMWGIVGMVENALLAVTACVVFTGFLSMLSSLLAGLKERRREMAILRSVGARPRHIFTLMVFEAFLLSLLGAVVGVVLMYAGAFALKPVLLNTMGFYLSLSVLTHVQWLMLAAVMGCGTLVGVVPAWQAYRYSLSDGMSIRI